MMLGVFFLWVSHSSRFCYTQIFIAKNLGNTKYLRIFADINIHKVKINTDYSD